MRDHAPHPMSDARTATGPSFRPGAVTALPFALVVGLFGISFGVLSVSSGGIGPVQAVVMSASTFAGSAQFAAASIVATGGQPITAIAAAILLNARYLPIGISIARFLPGGPLRRLILAQLVVDESWALASKGDGEFDGQRLIGAGIVLWLAWVAGTVIGVIGGEALGDPARLGLDAAFPALFLGLLVPQLRSGPAIAAALLGAGIVVALTPVTPPGVPIIAASAAALIALVRR
jgi:4-azaleucine resistance transporter AzlC